MMSVRLVLLISCPLKGWSKNEELFNNTQKNNLVPKKCSQTCTYELRPTVYNDHYYKAPIKIL